MSSTGPPELRRIDAWAGNPPRQGRHRSLDRPIPPGDIPGRRDILQNIGQRILYGFQAAAIAAGFFLVRLLPLDWASALGGFVARSIGPHLGVSRVGRRNLAAAFPEKSPAEIETILRGVWDNLGRTGAEYAQLDRIYDTDPMGPIPGGRITVDGVEAFMAHMRADHSPVEDVGRIAAQAGVKTLVLSHLTPAIDSIGDDTWRAPAAKNFSGEIIVAKDLMVI